MSASGKQQIRSISVDTVSVCMCGFVVLLSIGLPVEPHSKYDMWLEAAKVTRVCH